MTYFEFRTNAVYVQGNDALLEIKRYVYPLGHKFLFILGCGPLTDIVKEKITKSFSNPMVDNLHENNVRYGQAKTTAEKYDEDNKPVEYAFVDYEGKQVTFERIDEIAAIAKEGGYDVLIGVGGGKAMDLARGAHHKTGAKVALVPTSSASNASSTRLSVIYSEDGSEMQAMWGMDTHPDLVVADTNLLITAPPITLAAGIGDCMGAYYETLLTFKENASVERYPAICEATQYAVGDIFYKYGYLAVKALETKLITPAFESVIANILHYCGPMVCSTLANYAHVLDEVLLAFEPSRRLLHGMRVGYGVIPMLVYGNFPMEEIYKYIDLASSVGIPVSLEQLGIPDVTIEEMEKGAEAAINGPVMKANLIKFTKEQLVKNVFIADKIVTDYLKKKNG